MYATVRRYQAAAGQNVAEIIRRAEEGFVPIISKAPGFVAYSLIDAGTVLMTVSVFEDEEGAKRSVEMAAQWVGANMAGFAQGPPEVTTGEAHVHTAR